MRPEERELLDFLTGDALKSATEERKGNGLCDLIGYFTSSITSWTNKDLEDFEYFSGCVIYPIMPCNKDLVIKEMRNHDYPSEEFTDDSIADYTYNVTSDMWVGSYGARRFAFVLYLVEKIKAGEYDKYFEFKEY